MIRELDNVVLMVDLPEHTLKQGVAPQLLFL
mgnify:CR=1 FL=1